MPYADNAGTRLYWEAEGSGEPLLLIMGLGYTSALWYRLRPLLARRYRTIVFDHRGVGQSDAPEGPYLIPTLVADTLVVLAAAGAERAHMLGFSLGGMIAQELALAQPQRVRALVLAATTGGGEQTVAPAPAVWELLRTARLRMDPDASFWALAPYLYAPSTPRTRLEEDRAVRLRTYPPLASYLAQLHGVQAWAGAYARLSTLRMPTLVLHGEQDQLTPPANARVLAQAIPGARLALLPNAGHLFFTDQPAAASDAILTFLGTVDPAERG